MEDLPAIVFKDVDICYGDFVALERINLTIARGELVSVVGPNGGGKTTLLHAVLGFVLPSSGSIQVLEGSPQEVQPSGRIGYLPQLSNYDRNFPVSARDVVAMARFAQRPFGTKLCEDDRVSINESLNVVGMLDKQHHHFGSLSGGQRQRILIARALAGEPELLILDEPSTGLDAVAQDSFYHLLQEIRHQRDITILMVSHDIGTVSGFVDQIACLNRQLHYHGRAKDCLTPEIVRRTFGPHMNVLVHDENCTSCEHAHE
ncbi:metal ABC transporter ATP-binding protein [bacterium]|nr:metal ABC transporter ATP-binding protein [bacterium]